MSQVLGVIVIARNGDRTNLYQDPKSYVASLAETTALGDAYLGLAFSPYCSSIPTTEMQNRGLKRVEEHLLQIAMLACRWAIPLDGLSEGRNARMSYVPGDRDLHPAVNRSR